jgi:hypothetical protein
VVSDVDMDGVRWMAFRWHAADVRTMPSRLATDIHPERVNPSVPSGSPAMGTGRAQQLWPPTPARSSMSGHHAHGLHMLRRMARELAMFEIDVQAWSGAPPASVWAILTDTPTWTTWSHCDQAVVESGHKLGEVRSFRVPLVTGLRWPYLTSHERTTAYEAPRRWGYELLSGVPGASDYTAEVTLTPIATGGTGIRWRVSFNTKLPGIGRVLRWKLHRVYAGAAAGLAQAAATSSKRA